MMLLRYVLPALLLSVSALAQQIQTVHPGDLPAATATARTDTLLCVQGPSGRTTARCPVSQVLGLIQPSDVPHDNSKADGSRLDVEIARALAAEATRAGATDLLVETTRARLAEAGKADAAQVTSVLGSKLDANGNASGTRVTIQGGNSARTMAEWAKDAPTPANFLASGQTAAQLIAGQMDATAVMATLANTGGGHIPCGTYRINSGFPVRNGLVGAGSDCVTLQSYVTSGDIINVPPGATNLKISGIRIWSMVAQTDGGSAIHIQGGNNIHLDDITTAGSPQPFRVIYQLDTNANTTFLSNFVFTNASGPCIQMEGGTTTGLVIETHISHGVISSCGDGILVNSGSGLYLDDVDALGNANVGIRFAINGDKFFFGASIHNSYADSNTGDGFGFECGAVGCGPINQITMTNVWAAGSGVVNPFTAPVITFPKNGIHVINPKTDGVAIVGGQVRANAGHGVYFEAGRNLTLSSVQILQNAFLNNTFCGIYLGVSATKVILNGNMVGPGGVDSTPLQGSRANQMASPLCRPTPTAGTDPLVEIAAIGNIMTGNQQIPLVGSQPGDAIIGPPVNGVSLNIGW